MNPRVFFSRQTMIAVVFCPLLLYVAGTFSFPKQKVLSDTQYQLTPQFFKFVSGGFWPAAVDSLWIEAIQGIGDANYSPETVAPLRKFYDLALSLDPNFYELYEQAGVVFSVFYDLPEPAAFYLEQGVAFYKAGLATAKFWTHPVTLYILLGYVYAFQENDWVRAKQVYLEASDVPGAPDYLKAMKVWLVTEDSEKVLAIRILRLLIQNTKDPVLKEKYKEKLSHYE